MNNSLERKTSRIVGAFTLFLGNTRKLLLPAPDPFPRIQRKKTSACKASVSSLTSFSNGYRFKGEGGLFCKYRPSLWIFASSHVKPVGHALLVPSSLNLPSPL